MNYEALDRPFVDFVFNIGTLEDFRGAVTRFPVKRDQLLLFAVTCDCKKLKAVNCKTR